MKSSNYDGTDAKPIEVLDKKELIKLEHEWRLKLKASGFSDIEMWDNRPKRKTKRLKFIKGHIRLERYKTYENFRLKWKDVGDFFRVIGLYAHHAPPLRPEFEKYRELLKEYSKVGYISRAIYNLKTPIQSKAFERYLERHFHEMLSFVNKLDNEELEYDDRLRDYRNN